LKPIALSLFLALSITTISAASPVDWVVGDVVVAAGNGSYQVWHNDGTAAKPSYTQLTLNPALNDKLGGVTTGCTFDSAYHLFTTNFTNSEVVRFSVDNGHGPISYVTAPDTTPALAHSESVAFDATGNFYVGYAGTNGSGTGLVKYRVDGTPPNLFSPPVENGGVDWIDVASDQQTIFYTSEGRKIFTFNTGTNPVPPVYADLSTLSGAAKKGKLFAIRILPGENNSGGVLVADQSNVKLVKASGGVITSVQVFNIKGESNLQALSLDPTNPARFWVWDASTNDLIQFDMSTGKIVVTLPTGSGTSLSGVCVDGGFSAAQNVAPQATPTPIPSAVVTPTSNTVSFTSPFTGAVFTATLVNLQKNTTVTLHDSLVDPSVAASDSTVVSLNPGNKTTVTGVTSFAGPLPCDQTLTNLAAQTGMYPAAANTCEVFEFEANPALDTSVIANVEICSSFGCPTLDVTPPFEPSDNLASNPRLLRNLDEDITDGVNTYPLSGTRSNCVYTVNDQTFTLGAHSCGFQSPSQGQTFTKNQGSSLPFKFVAVGRNGSCPSPTSGALGAGTIMPLLMITQLVPGKAPISETVNVKGNSGGLPLFLFSGNTWQLQVDSTNLPVGEYLATVIDLSNPISNPNIPAFGVKFSLK
jgi:hypothetical protein